MEANRIENIIKELDKLYPTAECSLIYKDPLQLLVATQLSAQCTDARVNIVTKDLFDRYRSVKDFAEADITELEEYIRSTGFYRNKAKNIIACCRKILTDFQGKVPDSMDELLTLPGVGRKTANLVLGDIFGKPGVVVDTHAKRLSNRLGLTAMQDPVKIEFDLMKILPENMWSRFSHQLVLHGRAVCKARKPDCEICTLRSYCNFGNKKIE